MSQITVPLGMPKDLYKKVKDTAKKTGLSNQDVMRQAIKFGVPKVRQALSAEEAVEKAGPPPKFKLVKEGGYTVIKTDRKVSQETINELLADFP